MTLPLDKDIIVNVLRETCLAATLQLANSLSTAQTSSDDDSGFANLQSPALFGRLYREGDISTKLDIQANFPLLAKLPNGSPPIRFDGLSENMSRRNKNESSTRGNILTEESNDDESDEEDEEEEEDEDQIDEDIEEEEEEGDDETDEEESSADDSNNANRKPFISTSPILNEVPSGLVGSRQRNTSSASTMSSIAPFRRRRRPLPSADHHKNPSSAISESTITETEDESSFSPPTQSEHQQIQKVSQEVTHLNSSLASPPSLQSKLTPIRRPDLGDRSDSVNTLKSKSELDPLINTPVSTKSSSKALISASTSKTEASSGSKKQTKGLRSLGRFIRPKQIASTFAHHSATNSNANNLVFGSDGSEEEPHNNSNSGLNDKTLNQAQQPESSMMEKNGSFDTEKLEGAELDSVPVLKVDSLSDTTSAYAASSQLHSSKDYDEDDSKSNSERDTINSSDFEDNDSVVDSIESSELADSDYDYFNPPTTANTTRTEKRVSLAKGVSGDAGEVSDSALLGVGPNGDDISPGTSTGSSLTSGLRRSRGLYHPYEDPDVGDYIDDLDSEDYISDAEDYPIDDSVGYYDGDVLSANSAVGLGKDNRRRYSSSVNSTSSDMKNKLEVSPKMNSISKINFVRSRPGMRSTSGTGISRSLAPARRRQSIGSVIRPNTLLMSDTGSSLTTHMQSNLNTIDATSISSTSTANTKSLSKGVKSAKSYNNLLSMKYDSGSEEKEKQKEKNKEGNKLFFNKIDINKNTNNNLPSHSSKQKTSKLTELIHKKNISLDYYKYVMEKQSVSDTLLRLKICIPDLGIPYNQSLKLQVNSSVQVVELIGYVLYVLQQSKNESLDKHHLDPNAWKLYLADDDGEMEDDFGVLDRTRVVQSYGADEFVLVECTDVETKENEKVTPSPLENGSSQNLSDINPQMSANVSGIINYDDATFDAAQQTKSDSVATLPSELTPTSGLTFTNTLPSNNFQQQQQQKRQQVQQQRQLKQQQQFVLDDLDSDDDNLVFNEKNQKQVKKDIRKYAYLKSKLNTGSNKVGFNDKEREKESKLNKFKTRSKTIQSILHNTADHYQQTQQELFPSGNNTGNNMTFGSIMGNMNGVTVNNGVMMGATGVTNPNGVEIVNATNSTMAYSKQKNNNYLVEGEEGDNKALMYHRWTVWRRQQMSFKNKLPKTLTVDGYQIYLLPFNEFKGSWYESKTYNFDISQILKIKQNPKVPNYFKIIIKKNAEGIVKKYYLEARSSKECREIVDTIKALAKTYSEQM